MPPHLMNNRENPERPRPCRVIGVGICWRTVRTAMRGECDGEAKRIRGCDLLGLRCAARRRRAVYGRGLRVFVLRPGRAGGLAPQPGPEAKARSPGPFRGRLRRRQFEEPHLQTTRRQGVRPGAGRPRTSSFQDDRGFHCRLGYPHARPGDDLLGAISTSLPLGCGSPPLPAQPAVFIVSPELAQQHFIFQPFQSHPVIILHGTFLGRFFGGSIGPMVFDSST